MQEHRRASFTTSRELDDFKCLLGCRDTERLRALVEGELNVFKLLSGCRETEGLHAILAGN